MKNVSRILTSFALAAVLAAPLAAQTNSAARYDDTIKTNVVHKLADNAKFSNIHSSVEDGIVTLTGTVSLYQQKLDVAKKVRKMDKVQGVRNLLAVSTTVPDAQLAAKLDRKLYYDRMGYDNAFNYVTVSVNNGVATLNGETRAPMGRDSAQSIANNMPGVKDVVNNITVAPVSNFDDQIRIRTARALYRDSVLGRYAIDPAKPIRILVNNGKVTLEGTVANKMDKQVAGMRANQVFGVFKVNNNLEVAGRS